MVNSKEPRRNVYVGHRYVPLIMGQWDNSISYEGLSIVQHEGNSYTSRKHVPIGVDILNEEFWAVTGNYNLQVEQYRQEVIDLSEDVDLLELDLDTKLDREIFNNKVDELNNEIDKKANQTYVDSELEKKADEIYVNNELGKKADQTYVNEELSTKLNKTKNSVNIFISSNGNDDNSGTIDQPLQTLEKAVSLIPDSIAEDHSFIINIGTGNYSETLEIKNKIVHGLLEIRGTTEDRENHKIYNLRFDNITGYVKVNNISTTTLSSAGFVFSRCTPHVAVNNVSSLGDPTQDNTDTGYIGLLADYGSQVLVSNSDFSHKRYGIRSNYLSRIFSLRNTGTGNFFGIGARWGGILQTYDDQPQGQTKETTDSGGLILTGKGLNSGIPRNEVYLQSEEKAIHDGLVTKRSYKIVNINNSNQPIQDNEQIVITFDYNAYGPILMNFAYGGTKEDNFPEFIKGYWSGGVTTFIRSGKTEIIHSNGLSSSNVSVENISGMQFKLIITPTNAQSGNWSVDLDIEMMRNNSSAPYISNVAIETI